MIELCGDDILNMKREKAIKLKKERRAKRVRAKIFGLPERPRLSVFRSNQHLYAQIIDDVSGKTICAVSDAILDRGKSRHLKIDEAKTIGKTLAEKAKVLGITKVIYDRGAYKYHGRVKSLAEGARENGLEF